MDNLVLIIGLLVMLASIIGALYLFMKPMQKSIAELKVDITGLDAKYDQKTDALRRDFAELRVELKGDIADLRTELKGEISGLDAKYDQKTDAIRKDIAEWRAELKSDISELRTELKPEISGLDTKYDQKTDAIRRDILGISQDLTSLARTMIRTPDPGFVTA
jgi:uncharacterized lipoprotein YmbA